MTTLRSPLLFVPFALALVIPEPYCPAQESGNYVAFDVWCSPANVVDQNWTLNLTVVRKEKENTHFSLPVPSHTHEDDIAAFVAAGINVYCKDENLAEVVPQENSPDRVKLKEGQLHATAKPADRGGKGHIDIWFSNVPVVRSPGEAGLSSLELWLWHLENEDFRLQIELRGKHPNGQSFSSSETVFLWRQESMDQKIQKLMQYAVESGFMANQTSPASFRISPAPNGLVLEQYSFRLGPLVEDGQGELGNVLYGLSVTKR
ncbi:MAG: hypothetical protein DWQ01_05425 [Planctomycetota bacterium]|nr:MAG: hypothetical protein DWQ01_05425 [Planctomycetota bacterium]